MNTKFSKIFYQVIVLYGFCLFFLIFFIIRGLINHFPQNMSISRIIILFFLFSVVALCIYSISQIKFINFYSDKIKSYSLFHPFGKFIYFKDFKGIYKTTETGTSGTYDVVYLVDHDDITRFKIMGLYYKNMDEIIQAIPLPVIKKNLSPTEYIKLMFTGRANLSKIKDKKNTDNKIAFYFKIFIAITFTIFIIGMMIRIFSRI